MNSYKVMLILSGLTILWSLFTDLIFYFRKSPVFMSNQYHVNLYILPLLISYTLFTMAVLQKNGKNFFSVLILMMFATGYVFLIGKFKIVLKGAGIDSVMEEMDNFMKNQGKNYRIFHVTEHLYSIEINNYQNAVLIKDMEKWVEIDSIIHKDEKFLEDLDSYFIERAPHMPLPRRRPNIFFYLLVILTILTFILFIFPLGGYVR